MGYFNIFLFVFGRAQPDTSSASGQKRRDPLYYMFPCSPLYSVQVMFILDNNLSVASMDEKDHHQPLLPLASHAETTATTCTAFNFEGLSSNDSDKIKSFNFGISLRLLLIVLIGVISIWASHEASKGFMITVVNNMKDTSAGEKFTLFYVSNDEAIRLVQSSSTFAAKVLFPYDNSKPEKLINQVDVQLVSHNLTYDHTVAVKSFGQKSNYVLSINPLVMESGDFRNKIRKEIQRGMAEILLFNQQHRAPKTLLDGMVEYISDLAGFGSRKPVFKRNTGDIANTNKLKDFKENCWEAEDSIVVAKFLAYCEKKSEGFVGRLNQEMNGDGWYEKMIGELLRTPAIQICAEFQDSMIKE